MTVGLVWECTELVWDRGWRVEWGSAVLGQVLNWLEKLNWVTTKGAWDFC